MKKINLILLSLILGLNSICAQEIQQKVNNQQEEFEYRISAYDVLEISVYQEPDLTKTVKVSANGEISFPLLGTIFVSGLTPKELEKKITDLLQQDYLVNPQVSVNVKEYPKFSVLGEVKTPGTYELKRKLTVVEAIALAGGFTEKANTTEINIIRTEKNEKKAIPISIDSILKNENEIQDIYLKPADVIVVKEKTYSKISVLGQVRSPGTYELKKAITAVEAIALAGGLTSVADANGTYVIRTENNNRKIIRVPVGSILKGRDKSKDITLLPGDIVFVPESFF